MKARYLIPFLFIGSALGQISAPVTPINVTTAPSGACVQGAPPQQLATSGATNGLYTCGGGGTPLVWGQTSSSGGGTLTNPITFAATGGAAPGSTANGSTAVTAGPVTFGLVIGINTEAWSANLDSWSAITTSSKQALALPVGVCQGTTAATGFSLPSNNAPLTNCIIGSNVILGELNFPLGAETTAQYHVQVPYNLDCTQPVNLLLKWRAVSITGSVIWGIQTEFTATAALLDGAWNTASTATVSPQGTTLQLTTSTISGVTKTGCAIGSEMFLNLYRLGTGSDTMVGDAELLSATLQYTRSY